MFSPEERQRAVDLYSATPVIRWSSTWVIRPGSAWNAGWQRIPGMPAIWQNPSSRWRRDQGNRIGAGRHARKRAAERLGAGLDAVHNWVRTYREGGMTALRPKNRNAGQTDKPAMRRDRDADDAEALRRRIEELELGNAVMREVVEVVRKRPGRRPAAPVGQGEDVSGRPSAPDVFTQLDDMLARHRTGQQPTATTPDSGLTDAPGCVSGWPGRSPLPGAGTGTAGSGPCSGPASRRR